MVGWTQQSEKSAGENSTQDFKDIIVWAKSHELVLLVYQASAAFGKEELYGLTSQMRRAAVSIPSNIAEGCVKSSDNDFARFLNIALGSASELSYQIILAHDLNLLNDELFAVLSNKVEEVRKMLIVFVQKLRSRIQ